MDVSISRPRWWVSLACVSAVVLGSVTIGAARADEPPPADPAVRSDPRSPAHDVTLVTGDRIQVVAGDPPSARVLRSAPGVTAYASFQVDKALYVIPDQAMPLIASGRVDQKLFDVTGLVAQGYDDTASAAIPVIVQYDGTSVAQRAAPAAARVSRDLPSVAGVAADVAKADAPRFWQGLVGGGRPTIETTLTSGATKLWLDAQVQTTVDANITQIGAPAAWQRGFDGTGVKVAVLDSGVDTTHPDLAGHVVAAHDFTDEQDTDDRLGHGTHVASIVAGTGAASDGTHIGVAHGVRLVNSKVMKLAYDHFGRPHGVGRESWILAGMQWAVDQGARIVNMSLGNSYPDGNDPLSRAVNVLTARTGTLFVVSAGNAGPGHYTVGGPAAADAALAVGSVNSDDSISSFSSLGPRMIDGALKPDVTAPGNGIVAARAANAAPIGPPVGDHYLSLSGTSMAAPHVAGAAAILSQQHPDWRANELRAALTSTASYNAAVDAYSQGGGRIDVDRATRQAVFVDAGTLNAGYFAANAKNLHATKKLTYRNASTAPVTLTLEAKATGQSAEPAPAGTLTVSPAALTVAAGGTATAEVRVDLTGRPAGAYNGRVTATGADGLALGTTVGFVKQGAEVQATFRALDRNGRPADAFLVMRSPRMPDAFLLIAVPPAGSTTVQLAQDDYSLLGYVRTPAGSTDAAAELTVVADPELSVAPPNPTITYDARRAQPFDVRVPRDVDVNGLVVGLQVHRPELEFPIQESFVFARPASYGSIQRVPMSVLPFQPPRRGHGDLDSYWSLVSPRARASVVSPVRRDVPVALMDGPPRLDMSADLPLADLGNGTAADFDGVNLTGKLPLVRQNAAVSFDAQAAAAAHAGASALLVSAAQPGPFFGTATSDIPVLAVSQADGDMLRDFRRAVRIRLAGHSSSSYLYDLAFREHDRVGNTVYRPDNLAEVRTTYYANDARAQQRFWQIRNPEKNGICGYCRAAAREGEDWRGAVTRTEYMTAGTPWQESLLQDGWLDWRAVRTYPRGVSDVSWAKAPVVPGVPIQAGIVSARVGDQLRIRLAGVTDADPAHYYDKPYWWFQGTTDLSRDGQSLGECRTFLMLNCDVTVPPEAGTYRLAVNDPAPVFSDAAQSSKTTWTFHSRAGESTLPLIDLDYDLPVSATNTIRAGRWTSMRLGVARQPHSTGGRLTAPTVQVSYDDGVTWQATKVTPTGRGRYGVAYRLPRLAATNGFVALRVSAADAGGNAVVQEISRAYRLVG